MKHYKTQQAFVCSVPVFPISGELLARDMNNCQNKSDYEVFQSSERILNLIVKRDQKRAWMAGKTNDRFAYVAR